MLTYMDNWFGLVDREADQAYTMDDYGNAMHVPFYLPSFYWQEI